MGDRFITFFLASSIGMINIDDKTKIAKIDVIAYDPVLNSAKINAHLEIDRFVKYHIFI